LQGLDEPDRITARAVEAAYRDLGLDFSRFGGRDMTDQPSDHFVEQVPQELFDRVIEELALKPLALLLGTILQIGSYC
jgi:hypothetical protein